jgi:hypothetical protein
MSNVKTIHLNSLPSSVSSLIQLPGTPFTLPPLTQFDFDQHSTAQHSTAQHSTAQHLRPQLTIPAWHEKPAQHANAGAKLHSQV